MQMLPNSYVMGMQQGITSRIKEIKLQFAKFRRRGMQMAMFQRKLGKLGVPLFNGSISLSYLHMTGVERENNYT